MRQDVSMSVLRDIGKIVKLTSRATVGAARGVHATAGATTKASRWVGRNVGSVRRRGGVSNVGMMRLLDLHAASCAGDTLVTIGLAGTIFFAVPAGQARGRVALYLLVTMVPFALLAPLVGPLLDRFRHGRRFALSATMLGRAVLAWIIADNLFGFGLYPAAFGVLALSRAYGVARSAAVPRLLPRGLGLSQAGARASVYGTVAGAVVAPLGAAAFWLGPQWPLRAASLIFVAGAVVALKLPPKADSDRPETMPKIFQVPWRHRVDSADHLGAAEPSQRQGDRVLSGRLVIATLAGSASLRALYGFLLLFLAFAVREHDLPAVFVGIPLADAAALGLVGGALALGTFLATAIGTGLRIRRPVRLQAFGFGAVAAAGSWAGLHFTLAAVMLFCLVTAIASGLAKLAVDASIQERIPDTVRASAFAHAETLLMLAWVAGGALGLAALDGRVGVMVAAAGMLAATARAALVARRLRGEVLRGRVAEAAPSLADLVAAAAAYRHPSSAGRAGSPSQGTGPAPSSRAPSSLEIATLETAIGDGARLDGARLDGARLDGARLDGPGAVAPLPAPAGTTDDDDAPPGFHIFRPTPPGSGLGDPR
jgi:MFS family permease